MRYLSVADALAIHAEMMERMGERASPVRDLALLESALLRPQNAAYYEQADVVRQAAVLAVGLSQNQAFVDGNKRTAFLATTIFLRVNDLPFTGDDVEFAHQIEAIALRADSLDSATARFEAGLREHVAVS